MVNAPARLLAVSLGEVAIPLALVVTAAGPPKAALAPVAGAVNVTVTPLSGVLLASFTVACSAAANAVFTVVLWGVPAVAEMLAGVGARLVRLKLAAVATPAVLAVTV